MVVYKNLVEALPFSVLAVSSLSYVIFFQWSLFHHIYPVPMSKLSKDLPHQSCLFCPSIYILGPDLNIMT